MNEPNELPSRKKLLHCVAYLNIFLVGHSQCRFDEHRKPILSYIYQEYLVYAKHVYSKHRLDIV